MNISFGTLFTIKDRPGKINVVTDPGDGKVFEFCRIFRDVDDNYFIRPLGGGTIYLGDVDSIEGQMSLEQIEDAVKLGYGGYEVLIEGTIQSLRSRSTEG